MKIGLSLSRCVRDIYEGKVALEDIIVIVARTDFDPENHTDWSNIWSGYRRRSGWSNPEWADIPSDDEGAVRSICISLKTTGRLHQPRQFGVNPARLPYYWLETIVPDDELTVPAVKEAFEQYKMLAGLTARG